MKLMIAGDLVPTASNYRLFFDGDIISLCGDALLDEWQSSDYRIVNLEAPITDSLISIKKSGPNLKIPKACVKGIDSLNISCCSLANNHIMDSGYEGLCDTLRILGELGIKTFGAGENIEDAAKPAILEGLDYRVGIYSCAEHEFSAASRESAGANVLGVSNALHIHSLKGHLDAVIVLFHGGKENYPFPTKRQRAICKDFVDAGADLVICQHSHCIGCEETYRNKTIVYGQGNFIFDYKNISCWNSSILIRIEVIRDESGKIILRTDKVPIVKETNCVRLALSDERERIIDAYMDRSKKLINDGFMKSEQDKIFSEGEDIIYHYAGYPRLLRGIDKKLLNRTLIRFHYRKKKLLHLLGLVQCETHREMVENYLKERIYETGESTYCKTDR